MMTVSGVQDALGPGNTKDRSPNRRCFKGAVLTKNMEKTSVFV